MTVKEEKSKRKTEKKATVKISGNDVKVKKIQIENMNSGSNHNITSALQKKMPYQRSSRNLGSEESFKSGGNKSNLSKIEESKIEMEQSARVTKDNSLIIPSNPSTKKKNARGQS